MPLDQEDGIDITANSVHPGGTRSTNIHIHNRLLTGDYHAHLYKYMVYNEIIFVNNVI